MATIEVNNNIFYRIAEGAIKTKLNAKIDCEHMVATYLAYGWVASTEVAELMALIGDTYIEAATPME